MIFEPLYESAKRGELLLVNNGLLHWHLRRDGVLVIREILVTLPGHGIGRTLLDNVSAIGRQRGAMSILAKCPADLSANGWYRRTGFTLESTETARSGRAINVWRLPLCPERPS